MDGEDCGPRYDAMIARVVLAISMLIWGALTVLGWSLVDGVREQHVPGYPVPEQIYYNIVFPLALTALSLALFAPTWWRRGGCLLAVLGGLMLAMLPLYLFYYTGGM
jgi:hypothetical protein